MRLLSAACRARSCGSPSVAGRSKQRRERPSAHSGARWPLRCRRRRARSRSSRSPLRNSRCASRGCAPNGHMHVRTPPFSRSRSLTTHKDSSFLPPSHASARRTSVGARRRHRDTLCLLLRLSLSLCMSLSSPQAAQQRETLLREKEAAAREREAVLKERESAAMLRVAAAEEAAQRVRVSACRPACCPLPPCLLHSHPRVCLRAPVVCNASAGACVSACTLPDSPVCFVLPLTGCAAAHPCGLLRAASARAGGAVTAAADGHRHQAARDRVAGALGGSERTRLTDSARVPVRHAAPCVCAFV